MSSVMETHYFSQRGKVRNMREDDGCFQLFGGPYGTKQNYVCSVSLTGQSHNQWEEAGKWGWNQWMEDFRS